MARVDQLQDNVMDLTGNALSVRDGYLSRSAALIRRHVGIENLRNQNKVNAHVLLDVRGPRFVSDTTPYIRVTRNYYVTREFLLLVVTFCDARTQSKCLRVRDRIVEH